MRAHGQAKEGSSFAQVSPDFHFALTVFFDVTQTFTGELAGFL